MTARLPSNREFLLLSSFCGTNDERCSNRRPCATCIEFGLVFTVTPQADDYFVFVRPFESGNKIGGPQ